MNDDTKEHSHHGEILLVLSKGEELVTSLIKYCRMANIESAWVSGLGALQKAEIAAYDLSKKEYHRKKLAGTLEIASLVGNITKMNGELIAHLHVVLSNEKMAALGGHLNSATVGATCEILINPFGYAIEREFNKEIGLNLIK